MQISNAKIHNISLFSRRSKFTTLYLKYCSIISQKTIPEPKMMEPSVTLFDEPGNNQKKGSGLAEGDEPPELVFSGGVSNICV
jgi:hypothetical protein